MKKNYNKILIIFSLIIFLYYILNRRIIHEGLNYNEMSKEQKKDHAKKFKDAKNNYKWIRDTGGYKLLKASGGTDSEWNYLKKVFGGKEAKQTTSNELSKAYPIVNKRRELMENHKKKFKDAKNNYKWIRDTGGNKLFKASGGTDSEWDYLKKVFGGKEANQTTSSELSKAYPIVNKRRELMENHKKKYKDARNNYNWIKDQGYKIFKASGGTYSEWEDYKNKFKGDKNISSDDLSKVYNNVNNRRKTIEDHKKKFKDAKNNYKWIRDTGGYKTFKASGGTDSEWDYLKKVFGGKEAKDVTISELSKAYPIVNKRRELMEKYIKEKKKCPGTRGKCFFKNVGALAKNMVNLTGAIVSTVSDGVKLSTNTVKLFT